MKDMEFSLLTCALVLFAGPVAADGGVDLEEVAFLDSSVPICDVADALGPGAVPECDTAITDVCADLGCPAFDIVDRGPLQGSVNGEITVCINVEEPPDMNLIFPVSGCVLIETAEEELAGPFKALFSLVYGAFGDYFVRSSDGLTTIRATFTQISTPGDPPLFINEGIRTRLTDDEDSDD